MADFKDKLIVILNDPFAVGSDAIANVQMATALRFLKKLDFD